MVPERVTGTAQALTLLHVELLLTAPGDRVRRTIQAAYNTYHRLLNASNAEARARAAFESLMARARAEGRVAPPGTPGAAMAQQQAAAAS